MDGERSEGVFNMAANTKALLMTAMKIIGAFRAHLMIAMVSSPTLPKSSAFVWLIVILLNL